MGQDFYMNIPYVDFQGNVGNIDGDPAAAMRYCVTGDTLLLNGEGDLVRFSDLHRKILETKPILFNYSGSNLGTGYTYNLRAKNMASVRGSLRAFFGNTLFSKSDEMFVNQSLDVKSFDGSINSCSAFFDSGEHPTIELELKNGMRIEGSKNHPVMVLNRDTLKTEWLTLQNILDLNENNNFSNQYSVLVRSALDGTNQKNIERLSEKLATGKHSRTKIKLTELDISRKMKPLFRDSFSTMEAARRVQAELLTHDIVSSLYPQDNLVYLRVIDEQSLYNLFYGPLHLVSKLPESAMKDKKILDKIRGMNNSYCNSNQRIIRNLVGSLETVLDTKLPNLRWTKTLKGNIAQIKNPKYILRNLESLMDVETESEVMMKVKSLLKPLRNYLTFDIKNVVETGEKKRVFSVRVDSTCHTFISNGFVSHNTESRLSKFSDNVLLQDLSNKIVPYSPNYDGTTIEPDVLPSKIPNLLVNGSYGIGSGYMSSIPPHNLGEISEILIDFIRSNGEMTLKEISKRIKPDYPNGGIVTNASELAKAYETGMGKINIRGEVKLLDKLDNKGRQILQVTSIPFMKSKGDLRSQIASKVRAELIEGIDAVNDLSTDDIKLNIHIEKGVSPSVVENLLYKHTLLESFQLIRLIAINPENEYHKYNIREIFQEWLKFRQDTLRSVYTNIISSKMERKIMVESLILALSDIDWVIDKIRSRTSISEATVDIMKKFNIAEAQAKEILGMKIKTLNGLEIDKLIEELEDITETVEALMEILASESLINEIIINEVEEITKKHSYPRRTKLGNIDTSIEVEDIIEDEDFLITMTEEGYVKRMTYESKGTQRRGGKGRKVGKVREGDAIKKMLIVNSKDHFLMFSNKGKVYSTKVWMIPEVKTSNSLGKSFSSFVKLDSDEKIVSAINLTNEEFDNKEAYLTFVTNKGISKRVAMEEFNNVGPSGLIATKLREGDKVRSVLYYEEGEYDKYLFLSTSKGLGLITNLNEINAQKRTTIGIQGFDLSDGDKIVGAEILDSLDKDIVTLTSDGLCKKTSCKEFPPQRRGGKGRILVKLNPDQELKNAKVLRDEETMVVFTNEKVLSLEAKEIPLLKRPTKGVKAIDVKGSAEVVSFILE